MAQQQAPTVPQTVAEVCHAVSLMMAGVANAIGAWGEDYRNIGELYGQQDALASVLRYLDTGKSPVFLVP